MNTFTLAIVSSVLLVVAAGPVPVVKDAATVKGLLYPIPMEYSAGPVPVSGPYALPPQPFYPPVRTPAQPDHIKLVLAVPAVVPPGTSISVTVNVNSNPTGATIVSVTNPVISSSSSSSPMPTGNEAIIVDANIADPSGPQFPEEFEHREPPFLVTPVFENSKDSPFLVAMQAVAEEAQKQQLAAAALFAKKKTA